MIDETTTPSAATDRLQALTQRAFVQAMVMIHVANGEPRIKVGERLPELTLPALASGEPTELNSFRGKKLLLIEFASW